MTTQKPKPKPDGSPNQRMDSFPADKAGGATVIDFLVKVEVVKSVLRTYVPYVFTPITPSPRPTPNSRTYPTFVVTQDHLLQNCPILIHALPFIYSHPYNPLKSLSHTFAPAPSGQVTLSRSTVLSLSGWSNTQFSYWARRAEAISVLAMHDDRLRTAATALQQRLRRLGLVGSPSSSSSPSDSSASSESSSRNSQSPSDSEESDAEEWARLYVTGKGLDVIIDEVKKRTGVSPFLRGKHSSLDPFGTTNGDGTGDNKVAVYMPTFQAEKYVHEVPVGSTSAKASDTEGKKSGKRKAMSPAPTSESNASSSVGSESGESTSSWQDAWSTEDILRFTVPVPSHHTQGSPPPAYSAEDPNAGFTLSDPLQHPHSMNSLSSALHYEFTPPPLPKKRRLAPAPASSLEEAYAAEALRLYHQQRHLHL